MKKLSLLLALALVLSSNVFAENRKKLDTTNLKRPGYLSDFECSRYEYKEDGHLYKDGILYDSFGVYIGCLDSLKRDGSVRIKGSDKVLALQKKKKDEYLKNPILRPEVKARRDSLKREQNKNNPRK